MQLERGRLVRTNLQITSLTHNDQPGAIFNGVCLRRNPFTKQ